MIEYGEGEAHLPQVWNKTNTFRLYYYKEHQLNRPNPMLQQLWQGSLGNQRWEDVDVVVEK